MFVIPVSRILFYAITFSERLVIQEDNSLVKLSSQGLASYTILNGVCVARLKCLKPPAMTTSRIFVSPACAPRAGPLHAIEPGTHAIAEGA